MLGYDSPQPNTSCVPHLDFGCVRFGVGSAEVVQLREFHIFLKLLYIKSYLIVSGFDSPYVWLYIWIFSRNFDKLPYNLAQSIPILRIVAQTVGNSSPLYMPLKVASVYAPVVDLS